MFAGAREAEESRGSSGRQVRTDRPCSQTPCCYHHSTEKIHKRTRRQHNTASHRQHRHNPRSIIHYMTFFSLLAVRCELLDYCSSVFGEVVVMCMLCNVILPNNCRYFDACKASNETCLMLPYISLYSPDAITEADVWQILLKKSNLDFSPSLWAKYKSNFSLFY